MTDAVWISSTVENLIHDNTTKLLASDPWTGPLEQGDQVWHVALGPAAALAWLWRKTGERRHLESAIDIVDQLEWRLAQRRRPFRFRQHKQCWSDRSTIEAGATLGWLLLAAWDEIDEPRRRRWLATLRHSYVDLRRNGNFSYFINGNYQVPLCELAAFWRLPGVDIGEATDEKYGQMCTLAIDPSSMDSRWSGYGWRENDEWGFFTEVPQVVKPAPAEAFDPEYAQLQLDRVVRLWLLTDDQKWLRYADKLFNGIWPMVNETTWTADFRQGTRRHQIVPFFNAGLVILYLFGDRSDLSRSQVRDQVGTAIDMEYRADVLHADAYRVRGYGYALLSLLIACDPVLLADARRQARRLLGQF